MLIHYITNYPIKGNCGQYQRVITAVIVSKAFDNHDKDSINSSAMYTLSLDKFALKVFN